MCAKDYFATGKTFESFTIIDINSSVSTGKVFYVAKLQCQEVSFVLSIVVFSHLSKVQTAFLIYCTILLVLHKWIMVTECVVYRLAHLGKSCRDRCVVLPSEIMPIYITTSLLLSFCFNTFSYSCLIWNKLPPEVCFLPRH